MRFRLEKADEQVPMPTICVRRRGHISSLKLPVNAADIPGINAVAADAPSASDARTMTIVRERSRCSMSNAGGDRIVSYY